MRLMGLEGCHSATAGLANGISSKSAPSIAIRENTFFLDMRIPPFYG
jgi:hypothetical protein